MQIVDAQIHVWGSGISKIPCHWHPCVTMFTEYLPWLKGRNLEPVLGEAICKWWGWDREA